MMITFLSAAGMDIWFVAREFSRFFKGYLEFDIYLFLIVLANIHALPQLGNLYPNQSCRKRD